MDANQRIQELYQEIITLRYADATKVLLLCEELSALADKIQDNYAKATALFYTTDAYLTLNQLDSALQCGTKAVQYMKSHKEKKLLGNLYNIIAIVFIIRHDELTGLSYYLKALEIAKEQNDKKLLSILYGNIGFMFDDYDSEYALKYLLLSEANVKSLLDEDLNSDESIYYNYEIQIGNVATSLLHSGKCQEALDKIMNYLSQQENRTPRYQPLAFHAIKFIAYYKLGMAYDMQQAGKDIISLLKANGSSSEHYKLLFEIVEVMIQTGQYDDALQMINILSNLPDLKDNAFDSCQLSRLCLLYDQKKGDNDALLTHYRDFYKYQSQKNFIQQNDYIVSIENKIALQQELELNKHYLQETKTLEQKTESDSLTGLYNRYGLNKYYDRNFNLCKEKREFFSLMIIDIDHFKTYNDTEGHLLGDSCIMQIADIIKKATGQNYYCARYGGDEFFVVCHNIPYLDIQLTASTIVQAVRDAAIAFPVSETGYITVSIGAITAIPCAKHTITEFISSADAALYRVKKASRNDYYIERAIIEK